MNPGVDTTAGISGDWYFTTHQVVATPGIDWDFWLWRAPVGILLWIFVAMLIVCLWEMFSD